MNTKGLSDGADWVGKIDLWFHRFRDDKNFIEQLAHEIPHDSLNHYDVLLPKSSESKDTDSAKHPPTVLLLSLL
jgi:hypothetical protein